MRRPTARLSVAEITLLGMLGAVTFGAKTAMSALPNIEPVSLLVMVYTAVLGWKALYPIYLYVFMEILFYGIQLWNVNYLYIWALLAVAARLLRSMKSPLGWAVLSGAFGLLFGALCAPVYLLTGGPAFAFSWWVSGIPYDIAHCAGNFVLAVVLFVPLRNLMDQLDQKMMRR